MKVQGLFIASLLLTLLAAAPAHTARAPIDVDPVVCLDTHI